MESLAYLSLFTFADNYVGHDDSDDDNNGGDDDDNGDYDDDAAADDDDDADISLLLPESQQYSDQS